jgi:hypothetical protein
MIALAERMIVKSLIIVKLFFKMLLAAGCWLLVAGCLLLAACCWLLVAGCLMLEANAW